MRMACVSRKLDQVGSYSNNQGSGVAPFRCHHSCLVDTIRQNETLVQFPIDFSLLRYGIAM